MKRRKFGGVQVTWLALLLPVLAVVLGGCGGDSASGPRTATGRFIDAPVAGLGYTSGGITGKTGPDSGFTYEVGKQVAFFVGGVVLGTADGAPTVTPVSLVPSSTINTPQVVAIAQSLQSIGGGSSVVTLNIPPDAAEKLKDQTINFATVSQNALDNLVKLVDQANTLVSEEDAKQHLSTNIGGEIIPAKCTVTPSAGANGSISPNTAQTVDQGGTTNFAITPVGGYAIASASGCGGALSGSTYTTGTISSNCTVTVT